MVSTQFSRYQERRVALMRQVTQTYGERAVIVLFAGFERECSSFRQESSFYYYTGLTEPGLVCVLDGATGKSTLWIPNCGTQRATWMFSPIELVPENAAVLGFDGCTELGTQCVGYQFHPFFPRAEYDFFLSFLSQAMEQASIATLAPDNPRDYIDQRFLLERIKQFVPGLEKKIVDIAPLVARMRRKKEMHEIELMYKAVEITALAQEVAAQTINVGIKECEVQASLEYMFTGSCARASFPSIVATGKNATILHYTLNNADIKSGDCVVVDIGAEYDYYCADITRTYPASGSFTKRQRELYNIVLEAQEYIAAVAKPGMWLSNKEEPEKSLNHMAKKFLADRGYADYFPHGIGHFLGLDVHDVGNSAEPLQPGDVITIEPGIYIPQEGIGIRIEDNYWIVEDGNVCLSEYIPKTVDEIEAMMRESRKG